MTQPGSWLRFGVNHDQQILVIEPLFEEANLCRRLIADFMRALDAHGIGSELADLPGTGESLIDIADVRLCDWREAVKRRDPTFIASFRGGALIDDGASRGVWRFAPETGMRIARDLKRTVLTSRDNTFFSGHALNASFLEELEAATLPSPANLRTVRLESDPQPADLKMPGSPLWRRAEPSEDRALAEALAKDLSKWIEQCAAC